MRREKASLIVSSPSMAAQSNGKNSAFTVYYVPIGCRRWAKSCAQQWHSANAILWRRLSRIHACKLDVCGDRNDDRSVLSTVFPRRTIAASVCVCVCAWRPQNQPYSKALRLSVVRPLRARFFAANRHAVGWQTSFSFANRHWSVLYLYRSLCLDARNLRSVAWRCNASPNCFGRKTTTAAAASAVSMDRLARCWLQPALDDSCVLSRSFTISSTAAR